VTGSIWSRSCSGACHSRKAGHDWKGLCPIHGEKTPSFYVIPDKKMFHCFGCGVSGDAIKFVMQVEGRSFREAV